MLDEKDDFQNVYSDYCLLVFCLLACALETDDLKANNLHLEQKYKYDLKAKFVYSPVSV
jgi:hypothetical protein